MGVLLRMGAALAVAGDFADEEEMVVEGEGAETQYA